MGHFLKEGNQIALAKETSWRFTETGLSGSELGVDPFVQLSECTFQAVELVRGPLPARNLPVKRKNFMKAIRVEKQGGPEVLKLLDIAPTRHRAQAKRWYAS